MSHTPNPASTRSIRIFLALYPDDAARSALADVIDACHRANPTIRWERLSQVHITARFIGDMPESALAPLEQALRAAIAEMPVIRTRIDATGVFPDMRRPSIVWVGLAPPQGRLLLLHDALEDVCTAQGFARDRRPWIPHLTIGRIKERSDTRKLENDLEACNFDPIPVTFRSLCIMESVLAPAGATHTLRARIDLKT